MFIFIKLVTYIFKEGNDDESFVPEVDARGFHESVFDGIGDYFPSWPAPYKRGSESFPVSPSLAQRLGLQPRNKFRQVNS